jgi:hypothetical protein
LTTHDHLLVAVAARLYPRLARLDQARQIPILLEIIPALLTAPFAAIALAGLVWATEPDRIASSPGLFTFVLAALVIIQRRPFTLHIELENGRRVPLFGSLSEIISWSLALIAGVNALWVPVLSALVESGWLAWQRRRFSEDTLWGPLSYFTQTMGGSVFGAFLALSMYGMAGGEHPFASGSAPQWVAALVATLTLTLGAGLVLPPSVIQINRLVGAARSSGGLSGYWIGLFLLPSLVNPFGMLGSLLYPRAGLGPFLFFVAGVVLVNLLAHSLSRASERNRQRSRELARLESLGQALLQAPAALETLPDLLVTHVGQMFFPSDRVEICLFGPEGAAFRLSFPPDRPPFPEQVWERLLQATGTHYVQREVSLPGSPVVYGQAVVVKIMAVQPGGGAAPACIGGVYLVRHQLVGQAGESMPVVQSLASQIASALYRIQAQAETLAYQKSPRSLSSLGTFNPVSCPSASCRLAAGRLRWRSRRPGRPPATFTISLCWVKAGRGYWWPTSPTKAPGRPSTWP